MLQNIKDIINHNLKYSSKNFKSKKDHHNPFFSFNFLELLNQWENIVGPMVYKHTRPLKITHKKLVIVSNHPAFSHQLTFLTQDILKKIIKKFPQLQQLTQIKFTTNPELFIEQQKKVTKLNPAQQTAPQTLHPLSPRYQELKKTAVKQVQKYYGESEFKDILTTIYLQTLLAKETR